MSEQERKDEDEQIFDEDDEASQWSDIDSQADEDAIYEHDPDAIQQEIVFDENDQGGFSDEETDNEEAPDLDEEIQDDSVANFTLHNDFVDKVTVFEPNVGDYVIIATGSGDDSAYLFHFNKVTNTIQQETVLHLQGHTDTVADIQFNFDGEFVATAGYDNRVGIWETKTGKLVHFLDGPGDAIDWVRWHPKGNLIACGSADTTAWLWNAKSGLFLNAFAGHSSVVTCGTWTNDGQHLVTGSEDASVRVWNPKTAECIHTFSGDLFCREGITCIEAHPHRSNMILCGSLDGSAALMNIETKRILALLKGHQASIECVAFNTSKEANMQRFSAATCGMDGKVCVWDSQTLKAEHKILNDRGVVRVMFDNDPDVTPFIYTTGEDRTVSAYDLRTGEKIKKATGHRQAVLDMAQISSGHLVTGSDDNAVLIFKMK
jgi:ribosome assembly protein SQT1